MRRSLFVVALCFAFAPLVRADIAYVVAVQPADKRINVTMTFTSKSDTAELQLPNWSPGAYSLRNGTGRIKDLVVTDVFGTPLKTSANGTNDWWVSTKKGDHVTVAYWIDANFNDDRLHFSGPSTYLYVVGQKDEKCTLSIEAPSGWQAYCGLDDLPGYAKSPLRTGFVAPTYDVLADNPVSVGMLVTDTYTSHGVPHTIVYHTGDPTKIDRPKTLAMCKFVSDSEGDFFGGLPFKKYIWHFNVIVSPGGGGGLEHLASTEITIANGLSDSTQTVLAHEYFHAWNVKRIRSSVLGPFDYTQLPKTGALWWLEGVTDYYASLLPFRYGKLDELFFMGQIARNVQMTRSAPARMEVSPYDSSYRVGEANNGRGNSNGYLVSYYNTGWLVGLCLDIELRTRTAGKKSLDDAEMVLWKECRNNQPGFPENGIRKALIQVGGAEMGPVYDQLVMKPGELPVEAELAKMGLEMKKTSQDYTDVGFDATAGQGGIRVRRVRGAADIKEGDAILQINDTDFSNVTASELTLALRKVMDGAKPGDKWTVKYKRGDDVGSADVTVGTSSRDVFVVSPVAGASAETVRLREGWYHAGKRPIVTG